jgi:hypothetical protein
MALTPGEIGAIGESKVKNFLKDNKFDLIFVFENKSKNGLDVVALKKYKNRAGKFERHILSIEVKTTTTTGSGPSLSVTQKNGFLNTGNILFEAATAQGRFIAIDSHLRKSAQYLFAAVGSGVPLTPLHVRLAIDPKGTVTAAKTKRVRIHSFTATTRVKAIFDVRL